MDSIPRCPHNLHNPQMSLKISPNIPFISLCRLQNNSFSVKEIVTGITQEGSEYQILFSRDNLDGVLIRTIKGALSESNLNIQVSFDANFSVGTHCCGCRDFQKAYKPI